MNHLYTPNDAAPVINFNRPYLDIFTLTYSFTFILNYTVTTRTPHMSFLGLPHHTVVIEEEE